MKQDDLPTILPDHIVQMVARTAYRREAREDAELEKRLAALRAAAEPENAQAAPRGGAKSLHAVQVGFGF
ncbi:hypothetical protein GCM10007386_57540 [Pseudoduganella dura]|nr:hypothetical protein GCM10007386_57540 [Pseudoduganella dura]